MITVYKQAADDLTPDIIGHSCVGSSCPRSLDPLSIHPMNQSSCLDLFSFNKLEGKVRTNWWLGM